MSEFFCDGVNRMDEMEPYCFQCMRHAEECDCQTMQWEDEGDDNAEKWAERGEWLEDESHSDTDPGL